MHVQDFFLVFDCRFNVKALFFNVDWRDLGVVGGEKRKDLVEVGNSSVDCLHQVLVGFDRVFAVSFLSFFATVDNVELEVRLPVSCFGCFGEVFDSLVDVLGNSKAFVVEDTHPVSSDHIALFSTCHVKLSCVFLALGCLLGMLVLTVGTHSAGRCVVQLSKGVAGTGRFVSVNDLVEVVSDFRQPRLRVEPYLPVRFVFKSSNVVLFNCLFEPVESFSFVLGHFVAGALDHEHGEDESCLDLRRLFLEDNVFEFLFGHSFKLVVSVSFGVHFPVLSLNLN